MREKQVEKALTQTVKNMHGYALKFISPSMNGVPDRLIILPGGRIAFIELKAPGGKLRPLQKLRHKQLQQLGIKVFTVSHPNQIEEVLNAI